MLGGVIAEAERREAGRVVLASPQVTVTADLDGERLTVSLTGEIDLANSAALSSQVRTIIVTRLPRHVVLDVEGVEFCDSAGVRMLTDLHDRMSEAGITCCLHRPGPLFRWLLGSLGVLRLVNERDDFEHCGGRRVCLK